MPGAEKDEVVRFKFGEGVGLGVVVDGEIDGVGILWE